jgi:hypothetical protein
MALRWRGAFADSRVNSSAASGLMLAVHFIEHASIRDNVDSALADHDSGIDHPVAFAFGHYFHGIKI